MVFSGALAVDAGQSDQQPADSAAGQPVPQGLETKKQHGVVDPHIALNTDETLKEGASCVKQPTEERKDFKASFTFALETEINPDYGQGEDDFL